MKTQKQMFYEAQRKNAEIDQLFSDLVKDGMTKTELRKNIDRRPALWGRFSGWLNVLPD